MPQRAPRAVSAYHLPLFCAVVETKVSYVVHVKREVFAVRIDRKQYFRGFSGGVKLTSLISFFLVFVDIPVVVSIFLRLKNAGNASLPGRILSYAKVMQAERKQACLDLPGRILPYAKVMQAERKQACLYLLRRSLPYAKVRKIFFLYNSGVAPCLPAKASCE